MMTSYRLSITTLLTAVLPLTMYGCLGSEDPHGSGASQDLTSLELVEELRIDGYEADLVEVHSLVMRADDVIIVAQASDYEARAFRPDGSELFRVGGRGEGPGEFSRMSRLGLIGDTLWVADGQLGRFSLFAPDGSFARSLTAPRQARPGAAIGDSVLYVDLISAAYLLQEDAFVAFARRPVGPQGQEHTDYLRVSEDGYVEAFLVRVGSETATGHAIEFPNGSIINTNFPFVNRSQFIADLHGDRWGVIAANLEHPEGPRLQLRMVDASGRTVIDRAYPFPFGAERLPTTVEDSVFEGQRERYQSLMESQGVSGRDQQRHLDEWERLARDHAPSIYPPLSSTTVGRDGTVWIGLRRLSGEVGYLVVDREGDLVGIIDSSRDIRVLDGDASVIWTVERDQFGIPSLVRVRVRPMVEARE